MPHESRKYDSEDTGLYSTNAYGGTDPDVDDTERFTKVIDLSVSTGAALDFKFLGNDSTYDLEFRLYKRRNENFDGTEALWKKGVITFMNDGTETVEHYTIAPDFEAGYFRVGMVANGVTTTFDVDVQMRVWRRTTTKA